MNTRVTFLLALGGLLAATAAFAQGATGTVSRPDWSRGTAPTSDFNTQGSPMTRNQMVRQRAAGASRQAPPAQTRRAVRRAHR